MRELKFRVWSKKQKTYNYKHPFSSYGYFYIDQYGTLFSDYGNVITPAIKQDDFIIEQYTGLHDKNGKEIYDGDVVKMPDWVIGPKNEKVRFSKLSCGFEPFVNGCFECVSPDSEEVEVIGNVHENPELLKDRND